MIITLLDGTVIDIEDLGIKRLRHYIPSLNLEHITTNIEGRGNIVIDSYYTNRVITVDFLLSVNDIQDYYNARDFINTTLLQSDEFYITFKKEPNKRWRVKVQEGFRVDPTITLTQFSLNFLTVDKYAESVQQKNQTFTTSSFVLNNEGTALIDPRENDLMVQFTCASTSRITITNTTNGSVLYVDGTLTNANTCLLNNIRFTINNTPSYSRTNGGLLTLSPGLNNFMVTGGTINNINFRYRSLFK